MPRNSKQELIRIGVLTPALLAELVNCSAPYIRRLCKEGVIKSYNVSTTQGKAEHRIQALDAIMFCREHLAMNDNEIPKVIIAAASRAITAAESLAAKLTEPSKEGKSINENLSTPNSTQQ